jgi:hypothetical protein
MPSFSPRFVGLALACLLVASCRGEAPAPSGRIPSTAGFSFAAPAGDWTFDGNGTWLKRADPAKVSFFVQADGGPLGTAADEATLLRIVRERISARSEDGSGRYSDTAIETVPVPDQPCVRYRVSQQDHGANNAGRHDAMALLSRGVFCVNPDDRREAIDLVYSIRHVPGFDATKLIAEGDAVLDSLRYEGPLPAGGQ